jgi:hypothetical protein
MEFEGFPKIPRLFRDIVITEKIDGTNGQIFIEDAWSEDQIEGSRLVLPRYAYNMRRVWVGSRTRWITPEKDNHGFAKWVYDNIFELTEKLGMGHHFGEWWGQGINRGYGLKEKRFSLFNVAKWGDPNVRPLCCHVVPVLRAGNFDMQFIRAVLEDLKRDGSRAAPGFMKPEGIVVFHTAGNCCFKVTIEDDEKPKGAQTCA